MPKKLAELREIHPEMRAAESPFLQTRDVDGHRRFARVLCWYLDRPAPRVLVECDWHDTDEGLAVPLDDTGSGLRWVDVTDDLVFLTEAEVDLQNEIDAIDARLLSYAL